MTLSCLDFLRMERQIHGRRETLQRAASVTVKRLDLGSIVRSTFSASTRFDSNLFI